MALNVIVKNTFLDVDDCDHSIEAVRKRSSSVPRTWKLRMGSFDTKRGPPSDISTSADDEELGEADWGFDPSTPEQPSPAFSCGDTTFQERLKMCSPAAGIQRGPYMSLVGSLSELTLPPAMQSEQPAARRSTFSGTLNPEAAEFKMPMPSPMGAGAPPPPFGMIPGFPLVPELSMTPLNSISGPGPMASPVNGGLALVSPMPSPGASRLNPKARAFEPGASVYGLGATSAAAPAAEPPVVTDATGGSSPPPVASGDALRASTSGPNPLAKDDNTTESDSGTTADSDDSTQSSQPTTAACWDVSY
mmetsp:Transcript_16220/g.41242  ORF Transcript_16220/g.41242 Transcript_16220/m.41242 type:complete len:305 (+) Transcript_16220:95-1009(+)